MLNSQSLKYQRFTPPGCKDIGIRKFEFVAITQIFYIIMKYGKRKTLIISVSNQPFSPVNLEKVEIAIFHQH